MKATMNPVIPLYIVYVYMVYYYRHVVYMLCVYVYIFGVCIGILYGMGIYSVYIRYIMSV